jgi:hypothetical protein
MSDTEPQGVPTGGDALSGAAGDNNTPASSYDTAGTDTPTGDASATDTTSVTGDFAVNDEDAIAPSVAGQEDEDALVQARSSEGSSGLDGAAGAGGTGGNGAPTEGAFGEEEIGGAGTMLDGA